MSHAKPDHLGPEYGAQFSDATVAAAYRHRPPYPSDVVERLRRLIDNTDAVVLELGCGTGELARALAPFVGHVDAVDPSSAMLDAARDADGGTHPHITWHHVMAESFVTERHYHLAIAAESLHWMEWDVVLPAIDRMLAPGGRLVILDRRIDGVAWWSDLAPLIPRFSTNTAYQRYDLVDELTSRGLFVAEGRTTTPVVTFPQRVDEYVESWHSRNGFSRVRMSPAAAHAFDEGVREVVTPHAVDGLLQVAVSATMVWGRPVWRGGAGVG